MQGSIRKVRKDLQVKELSSKAIQIRPSGIRKFFDLVLGCDDIISLGVGEPDFSTPWNITEHAIYQLEKGRTSYTSNYGLLELRREIGSYLEKKFDASYNPDKEILITIGVSEGLDLAFRTLLNDGDEVIVPLPNFVSYIPLITMAGGVPVTIDTSSSEFILTASQLESKIIDAHLILYP